MVKSVYMSTPQENFYSYVKKNTNKTLSSTEMSAELAKAKKGIQERNTPKGFFESWTNGIKKDYDNGKIGERIGNNPVVKGMALLLGGLTSCTPVEQEFDLVTMDFTDPVATGPVNKEALSLLKTLGSPIISSITPIQVMGYEDPTTNTKTEFKIDKEASKPDKIMYNGTVTNTKTSETTPLRCSFMQGENKSLIIENEIKNEQGEWTVDKKSEYKVNSNGRVAKYVDGKFVCEFLFGGGADNKLNIFYPDGSRKVINNFIATQVHGTVKK